MRRVKFLVGILLACVCFCSACGSTNPDRDKPIDQPEVIEYMESDDLNEARAGIYNKFAIPEGKRLKLPDIFGDNMIVQRDKPIRVWGVAPAGEKVTVRLRESGTGKSVVARGVYACDNNTFLVELPALQVSEKVYELVVECGASQRKFEKCSGGGSNSGFRTVQYAGSALRNVRMGRNCRTSKKRSGSLLCSGCSGRGG